MKDQLIWKYDEVIDFLTSDLGRYSCNFSWIILREPQLQTICLRFRLSSLIFRLDKICEEELKVQQIIQVRGDSVDELVSSLWS